MIGSLLTAPTEGGGEESTCGCPRRQIWHPHGRWCQRRFEKLLSHRRSGASRACRRAPFQMKKIIIADLESAASCGSFSPRAAVKNRRVTVMGAERIHRCRLIFQRLSLPARVGAILREAAYPPTSSGWLHATTGMPLESLRIGDITLAWTATIWLIHYDIPAIDPGHLRGGHRRARRQVVVARS